MHCVAAITDPVVGSGRQELDFRFLITDLFGQTPMVFGRMGRRQG
jgi:hypothetical protein